MPNIRRIPATICILLLTTVLVFQLPASSGRADPAVLQWEKLNIPTQGQAGGWVLAPGSDIVALAVASDGTLYAAASPSGATGTLFKSDDAGLTWQNIAAVTDTIVDVTVSQDNPGVVYYATASAVYKSLDTGRSFNLFPTPGAAGSGNISITSLAVAGRAEGNLVAVGTADADNGQYGGIFIMNEADIAPAWQDTSLSGYDVRTISFSPAYNSDRQLLAVVTDETDTVIVNRIAAGGWQQMVGAATITGKAATSADMAFPDGYNAALSDQSFYVALATGSNGGDVYRITANAAPGNSAVAELDVAGAFGQPDIDAAVLVAGGSGDNVTLIAGCSASSDIYISEDSGSVWWKASEAPTGEAVTGLLPAADFTQSGRIFAATSGKESAFSVSSDDGFTWKQVGLIDSHINPGGIVDLAVSPEYESAPWLFLITFDDAGVTHSLWRSEDGGAHWQRILCTSQPGVDTLKYVRLAPEFGADSGTVFVTGTSNGHPAVWQSGDRGDSFIFRLAPLEVDIIEAVGEDTFFSGGYDGTVGRLFRTDNGGFIFSEGTAVGTLSLKSLAVSPDFRTDGCLLIGNSEGWVYYSADNGSSFNTVPLGSTSPPLSSSVAVAFDPDFRINKTVYAVSVTANKGVYRFVIGSSTEWESIDTTLPVGAQLTRVLLSADGTIYAANIQAVNTSSGRGGVERSLDPGDTETVFQTVTAGIRDGGTLSGLWLSGKRLFTVDAINNQLLTYNDTLAAPVALMQPPASAEYIDTSNVFLEWDLLPGTSQYQWQLDYDTDFSAVPSGFEGTTRTARVRLPDLSTDTRYYWRVRASEPVYSRWSETWSFKTGSNTTFASPDLISPGPGSTGQVLNPVFQWDAVEGAENYDLVVSNDYTFENPVILKVNEYALPDTAWQSSLRLEPGTTYYWKVRGSGSGLTGAWSPVSAFTTLIESARTPAAAEPAQQSSPVPVTVQPSVPAADPPPVVQTVLAVQAPLPEWSLVIIGGLLLAVLLLLVVVLVLVVGFRRQSY